MKKILFPIMLLVIVAISCSSDPQGTKEFKDLSFNEKYDSILNIEIKRDSIFTELEKQGYDYNHMKGIRSFSDLDSISHNLSDILSIDTTLNKIIISYLKTKTKCPSTVTLDSMYAHILCFSRHHHHYDTMIVYKHQNRSQYDTTDLYIWRDMSRMFSSISKKHTYVVPSISTQKECLIVRAFWTANNEYNAPISTSNSIFLNRLQIDGSDIDLQQDERYGFYSRYYKLEHDWTNAIEIK